MDFDPEPFAKAIRERNAAEALRLAAARKDALAEAVRLAALIRHGVPKVERVILFGSVAEDRVRSLEFDIDLALVGGEIYHAEEIAATSVFRIDIADYNRLPEHIRSRIESTGIEL